jgi:hypothetical protein
MYFYEINKLNVIDQSNIDMISLYLFTFYLYYFFVKNVLIDELIYQFMNHKII